MSLAEPAVPDDPSNRRQHTRLAMSTKLFGRFGGELVDLPLSNLSYGGAFFSYAKELKVGSMLDLDLVQGEDTATTKARVVHSTDRGFAVSFADPPIPFTAALSRLLTRRLMESNDFGGDGYDIAGRIAMLLQQGPDYEVLFTTTLNKNGVWVLTDKLWAYSETLWISLLENGMFDCEVRVLWCTEDAMALEFINPSEDFNNAYQRVCDAFLG